ncbi:MAG: chemotaxis protein CheW [Bdellovibrionales bacterium]
MSKVEGGRFLTFMLKDEFYGVPISKVREINQMMEITPVPMTPKFVEGVVNLRGKILPIVNLREKLSFERIPYNRETCIIVIETVVGQVGVVVDAVREVIDLKEDQTEVPPHMGGDTHMTFLSGLGKHEDKVIILLDVDLAFSDQEFAKSMGRLSAAA